MDSNSRRSARSKREGGTVLLLTTLMLLFVILPAVGLAIDGGVAFAVKARLQTAADGAALAAARSLSRGIGLGQQQASAEATADEFFHANMHRAWSPLGNPQAVVSWPAAPPKTTIVRVDGSVEAPTYFMKMLGYNSLLVTASGAANRRDVNIMLVLDRSGSVQNLGACDDLRSAAKSFVDSFVDGRDRLGLVTFGTSYRVDSPPSFNFKSGGVNVMTMIDSIVCIGGTNSAAAYWSAWQQLSAINEPNTLNVILFFTDGQPNTLHMNNLKVNPASTCVDKSDKNGVITPAGAQVWGIFQAMEPNPPPARNPDWVLIPGSNGCKYASNFRDVKLDIISLAPAGAANEKDAFGNSLTGYKPVNRTGGLIRIDEAATVTNAGTNAFDDAAQRVRTLSAASGLDVFTYCIALGGAPAPAENTLLKRVANTDTSPIYDSTKPMGLYILASNPDQLEQAFSQLASDILRISH